MKYNFIGWCNDGKHDKIWACINVVEGSIGNDFVYVTVWGRRGKALQHKIVSDQLPSMYDMNVNKRGWSYADIDKKISSKIAKGYEPVSVEFLDGVYPEFQQDLKMLAVWATLSA